MRDELVKASKQTEQLVEEIQLKEKDLLKEKAQVEKLMADVAELQKEKNELRREIILIQNEAQTGLSSSLNDDNTEDIAQIKETVQYKNKHILQLLSDTEVLEKENEMLTTKLNAIRRELGEATTNLTKLSGENISLRSSNYELQEKVTLLEERNQGLSSQVSELVSEKNRRDLHLDQLIDALEERVAKWQDVFWYKENEIAELKEKLNEMVQSSEPKTSTQFATNYTILAKTIEQQEELIEHLKGQLKQAGEDLSRSTNEMLQLKKNTEGEVEEEERKTVEHLTEELHKANSQLLFLQEKVKDAEQDAQFRAEEMTELIIQLREYEEGVYGLAEARTEVKELKKQVAVRDKQILTLVQQLNNSDLNLAERESESSLIELDEKTSNAELRIQLNQIQQTAINLSVQNFDLKAQVLRLNEELNAKKTEEKVEIAPKKEETKDSVVQSDNGYIQEIEEKYKALIGENESLRKGLHEIMESIKFQDGQSKVSIESECLEKLLDALDSRHVSGWYHPAMRLQVALNKLQGNNDALRQQLRETRFRECYFQAELQAAFLKIGELEGRMSQADVNGLPPVPAPRTVMANTEEEQVETPEKEEKTEIEENDIEDEPNKEQEEITSEIIQPVKPIYVESSTQTETSPPLSKKDSEEINEQISAKSSRKSSVTETIIEAAEIIPHSEKKPVLSRQSSVKSLSENGQKNGIEKSLERKKSSEVVLVKDFDQEKHKEMLDAVIEQMRSKTENVLEELNESKNQIFGDVKSIIDKVNEHFEALKKEPIPIAPVEMKEIKEHEEKITHYGMELEKLKEGMEEKEKTVTSLQAEIDDLKKKLEESKKAVKAQQNNKKIIALKETVKGLQAIVQQKDSVIERCEFMLQENSKEYEKLLDQYNQLEAKALQTPSRMQLSNSKAVSVLMEKWVSRVQALETDIHELNQQLHLTADSLIKSRTETEKWKEIAESLQQKGNDDEPPNKEDEIDVLRGQVKEHKSTIEELKAKLRLEGSKYKKKEDEMRIKIKDLETENHKIKHYQNLRYPKSPHNGITAAKKELILMDKIKELEQEIALANERQKAIIQQRKERCADEVAKWEEKKKLQTSNEKLRNDLKDRNFQLEELEGQITRLKQIITRMERERIALQRRLKVSEGMLTKNLLNFKDEEEKENTESRLGMTTPRSDSSCSDVPEKINFQSRKDLIKVVAGLRKVVAKLRVQHSNYVQKDYVEQLQKELQKMEENYLDAVERALALEEQLKESEARFCSQTYTVDSQMAPSGYILLKEQLSQKCELLGKVKILLQRAMIREKQLLQQVTLLEKLVPPEKLIYLHDAEREH
ncbi:centrosomal protein of 290 kDa-like isoform X2 [Cimex lectularius]|nr:centrosomal protein of 290 kDa-like isoform X2 [Cimex lectularius]